MNEWGFSTIRSVLVLTCIFSNPCLSKGQGPGFQTFIEGYLTTFPDHSEIAIGIIDGNQQFRFGYQVENGAPLRVDNASTLFEIASITKTFTAALLMKEVNKGTMALDSPVQKYLPVKMKQAYFKGQAITPLHLATHTSGLKKGPLMGYGRYERYLKKFVLDYVPGQNWEYNNLGASLLGKMIGDVNNSTWTDQLRNNILIPLGMDDTYAQVGEAPKAGRVQCTYKDGKRDCYFRESKPFNWPAGGMAPNIDDMMKWPMANMDEGTIGPDMQFIHDAHNPLNDTIVHSWSYDNYPAATQGIIWNHQRTGPINRYLSHDGASPSQSSFMAFDKARKRGMVILMNNNGQKPLTENQIYKTVDLTYKTLGLQIP